jgi:multiple sugar transport system permease protein
MLTAFSLIPLLYGFWMSLHNIDIVNGKSEFIGLQNYFNLLHDPKFGLSLVNTAGYTLAVVPSIVVVSLAIAIFLRKSTPARLFARVGFYIPFVLSPVVVATSWKWLLNEDLGVVDGFLKWAGIATVPWLTDDTAARISVVVTTVWNLVGFYMLMVLAGLSQTLLLIIVLATIHATQAFETILLLTDGGPANATRLVVQNMYDSAFVRLQPGYGVTQAILLLPLILFIAWLQMRLFREEQII